MALIRKYTKVESRLLNEWYKEKHWGKPYWTRVRVGRLPDVPEAKYYESLRRWVDMVFVDGDTIVIVEAKMRPKPDAIGQLELYVKLFKETPEFEPHWDKPTRLICLTTRDDRAVRELCETKGIVYEIYRPAWVDDYEAEVLRLYGKRL